MSTSAMSNQTEFPLTDLTSLDSRREAEYPATSSQPEYPSTDLKLLFSCYGIKYPPTGRPSKDTFGLYDKTKYAFSPLLNEIIGHDLRLDPLVKASPPTATSTQPRDLEPGAEPSFAPRTISHGLSGFGRRNSLLLVYVAAFVLANQEPLKKQGLRLHFTIFEKQSEAEAGSGYSCQTGCHGALNTGLPGPVGNPIVTLDNLPVSSDLANLGRCIGGALQRNVERHKGELCEANLAARAMFADAINSAGEVETAHAFTTRGAVGTVQRPEILNVLEYIKNKMSNLITIEKRFEHEVIRLDLTDPQKPKLIVRSLRPEDSISPSSTETAINPFNLTDRAPISTTQQELPFDFVHLSNGTPWKSPIPHLRKGSGNPSFLRIFSNIPNLQSVGAFLEQCELLENRKTPGGSGPPEKRVLKENSRIWITGFSLSAFDFVPLILQYTSILRPNPNGDYYIDEKEADRYKGLLTFVSRTGVSPPPRHPIPDPPETTSLPEAILTTKEVHTMLLQRNFQWLQFWKVFLDANVARSLPVKVLPRDLQYKQKLDAEGRTMTAEGRMENYAQQNDAYANKELTEAGLLRAGYWSVYQGQGFEVGQKLDVAEQTLVADAPLTRRERAGYLLRRGPLSDITDWEYVNAGNPNKDFFDEYGIMMHTIAASPTKIHHLVARMFQLGVAGHCEGSFDELSFEHFSSSGVAEAAHGIQALFAPLSPDLEADKVYESLRDQVAAVNDKEPECVRQPEYAKGRFLKDRTRDRNPVHVMDMGMGGGGSRVPSPNQNGQDSKVGMRWPDTSTLDAAVNGAATAAVMSVLLSSYALQESIKRPVDHLLSEYRDRLPTPEQYRAELVRNNFEGEWKEIHKKHAFLCLCESVARDGPQYASYTEGVFLDATRREIVMQVVHDTIGIAQMERDGTDDDRHALVERRLQALAVYYHAVGHVPRFEPPTVDQYFERFVDFTPFEIKRCWNQHRSQIDT
ncbi:hypothetical protein PQX77_019486 [Marasmius sp. AFHP31]|nr:hypothetical protein PQX77_019486 [Marasmius sp. AFHP31]